MELLPNENFPRCAKAEPFLLKTEPGKVYSWCTCGLSEKQPLCDSRHKNIEGLPYRSIKIRFEKEEEILLCQCKQTKTPPYCDDTHLTLKK